MGFVCLPIVIDAKPEPSAQIDKYQIFILTANPRKTAARILPMPIRIIIAAGYFPELSPVAESVDHRVQPTKLTAPHCCKGQRCITSAHLKIARQFFARNQKRQPNKID